jgi:hypothetical protein
MTNFLRSSLSNQSPNGARCNSQGQSEASPLQHRPYFAQALKGRNKTTGICVYEPYSAPMGLVSLVVMTFLGRWPRLLHCAPSVLVFLTCDWSRLPPAKRLGEKRGRPETDAPTGSTGGDRDACSDCDWLLRLVR